MPKTALVKKFGAVLVGLYVINPFLKKFTNEIYAINRDECREYLDRSLTEEGEIVLRNLFEKGLALNLVIKTKTRYGDPKEEILEEIKVGNYDLVVMGVKFLRPGRNGLSLLISQKRYLENHHR